MSSQEVSLLARWSSELMALLEAGPCCELVAAVLLRLFSGAAAAQCQLDGVTGSAGQALPESGLLTADVVAGGRVRGRLTVSMPPGAVRGQQDWALLLALAARLVALQLPPDPVDQRHLLALVTVGEATGWLVHALNNHLNGMVLQAACVQMQTQPPVRDQIEHIRREGARAAARLRPLQAIRPWPAHEGERNDLLSAIRDVLHEPEFAQVRAELPAGEIPIPGSVPGLRRMLTLLFRVAQRCMGTRHRLSVAAERKEGETDLLLVLPGVRLEGETEGLDALPPEQDAGLPQLEREAARWLVRQTGGTPTTHQEKGSVTLRVRWQ